MIMHSDTRYSIQIKSQVEQSGSHLCSFQSLILTENLISSNNHFPIYDWQVCGQAEAIGEHNLCGVTLQGYRQVLGIIHVNNGV